MKLNYFLFTVLLFANLNQVVLAQSEVGVSSASQNLINSISSGAADDM
jgi:hypothetical protein